MKKKIIIADDNANIRLLLSEFLKSEFEVQTFDNGVTMLKYLEKGQKTDLIIMDVQMPHLNGWDIIQNLKVSQFHQNIPVLILSGIEKTQEKIKFLEAGAEDYMVKPFSPEELKVRINNIFKREEDAKAS